jgi:hypothetical protein
MEDDCPSFGGWDSLQCINDSGLLTGHLNRLLMHIGSQNQFAATAPPPDCQVVCDPAYPTFWIVVLGNSVPLAPRPDKCFLNEILRFGGVT